ENDTGYLPPLKTKIENLGQYELIFIGFPTWGMQLPPPMKSFLSQNDLSGKTVIPFNTNAGYGIGSSFDTVKELCPDSEILEGFSARGGIERKGVLFVMEGEKEIEVRQEVKSWLEEINLLRIICSHSVVEDWGSGCSDKRFNVVGAVSLYGDGFTIGSGIGLVMQKRACQIGCQLVDD